jgi:hypothetical protein
MNCWGIRIYFTKSRFSLNKGYIVYMELLSGHEKIITKSRISLNAGTLNQGFTVHLFMTWEGCGWKQAQNFLYTTTVFIQRE